MTATLLSGRNTEYPESFVAIGANRLLVANGLDPVVRWDGFQSSMENAGVAAPTTAIALNGATLPAGNVSGTFNVYCRFVDRDGNVSNLSPASGVFTVTAKKLVYLNVPVPTESKVTRRQIIRNTSGQFTTFYVDVDTTDLTSTTLESNRPDSELDDQEVVVLVDEDGNSLANAYGVPPNHKSVLAQLSGRVFALGEIDYTTGNVKVTNGSTTIAGVGTAWTSAMATRQIHVLGAPKAYTISSVDVTNQQLTISEAYGGTTDIYARYSIRSVVTERRSIRFSQPYLPDAWPATNILTVEGDADLTGAAVDASFLYVLEANRIHRLTFQDDPLTDGAIYVAANRGCINNRCWVAVEDGLLMLDRLGIHLFAGNGTKPLSETIQELFRSGTGTGGARINWRDTRWWHAIHDPADDLVRWFVTMSGNSLPRDAIVFDRRTGRTWTERYPVPLGASAQASMDRRRAVVGGMAADYFGLGVGYLDAAPPTGTLRGNVDSATVLLVTDSDMELTTDHAGATVAIVAGRGKGQVRRIVAVDGPNTRFMVDRPFLIVPDSTSVYQVGAIEWQWRSGSFTWNYQGDEPRRVVCHFRPTQDAATMDLRIFADRSETAKVWESSRDEDGIKIERETSDIVIDRTRTLGSVQQRLDEVADVRAEGARVLEVELAGFSTNEPTRIYGLQIDGAQA